MNDSELNRILRSAEAPKRTGEYWDDFPRRVVAGLKRAPARGEVHRSRWFPRLAWGLGLAAACLIIGFVIGHQRGQHEAIAANGILQNEKVIREVLAMFPNRVRAIVQDEKGMSLILSEQPDIPVSTPLWVQVCQGEKCQTLVTFSGQELQIAGQRVTVLSDAEGGVIVTGERFAWASADSGLAPADLRIQARTLEMAALK